jgi:hypothetical protein
MNESVVVYFLETIKSQVKANYMDLAKITNKIKDEISLEFDKNENENKTKMFNFNELQEVQKRRNKIVDEYQSGNKYDESYIIRLGNYITRFDKFLKDNYINNISYLSISLDHPLLIEKYGSYKHPEQREEKFIAYWSKIVFDVLQILVKYRNTAQRWREQEPLDKIIKDYFIIKHEIEI